MLVWLCLCKGADLHMAQLMSLPLTITCSSKSRLVLLPDRTIGRAIGTAYRLSVCRLSVCL